MSNYLGHIDWEPLQSPQEWELSEPCPELPDGVTKVSAKRNASYLMEVELIGVLPAAVTDLRPLREQTAPEVAPGTLMERRDVSVAYYGGKVVIKGYVPMGFSGGKSSATGDREFRVPILTTGVIVQHQATEDTGWITDWFVNGPYEGPWRHHTDREFSTKYKRSWATPAAHKTDFSGHGSTGLSFDHFLIRTSKVEAVVHAVPAPLAPDWSHGIGITYLKSDGTLPNPVTRDAVEELLGFVFGRRLMRVGSTNFDADGYVIWEELLSPWGTDVQGPCGSPDRWILPFHRTNLGSVNVEEVMATLLPRYLENRETLRLDDVLWRMWLGTESPAGLDIPIYASGAEMLRAAWFEATKSKSKGKYMSKRDFDELLAEEMKAVAKRLEGVAFGDRMLRRMQGAFQTSGNERVEWFFEEIGLRLGTAEKLALKARNQAVHPATEQSAEERVQYIRTAHVYRTLLVRTILKVLAWNGPYKDYGILGHPLRPLDQSSGDASGL